MPCTSSLFLGVLHVGEDELHIMTCFLVEVVGGAVFVQLVSDDLRYLTDLLSAGEPDYVYHDVFVVFKFEVETYSKFPVFDLRVCCLYDDLVKVYHLGSLGGLGLGLLGLLLLGLLGLGLLGLQL